MSKKPTKTQQLASMRRLDELVARFIELLAQEDALPHRAASKSEAVKKPSLRDVYLWAVYRDLQDGERMLSEGDEALTMWEARDVYQDAFVDDPDFEATLDCMAFDLGQGIDPDFTKRKMLP